MQAHELSHPRFRGPVADVIDKYVSRHGISKVMRETTYTGDKGWGRECEHRILHSSIGKARWEHKNVVGGPLIGVNYFLLIELENFRR